MRNMAIQIIDKQNIIFRINENEYQFVKPNILYKNLHKRIKATLKTALYRTRKDRDKYKELYLSEKERADRHRERLREKRSELFKLKKGGK